MDGLLNPRNEMSSVALVNTLSRSPPPLLHLLFEETTPFTTSTTPIPPSPVCLNRTRSLSLRPRLPSGKNLQTSEPPVRNMPSSTTTLNYFGMPGRAEAIRLALTCAGKDFEDKKLTFPEYGASKWAGKGLPVLEVRKEAFFSSSFFQPVAGRRSRYRTTSTRGRRGLG